MTAKIFLSTASLALILSFSSTASSALIVPDPSLPGKTAKTEDPRASQLIQRLEYIKGMDKSGMSRMEKKSLRKEVKGINKEMKVIKGGVYLSVGAIIIIILLLILLL